MVQAALAGEQWCSYGQHWVDQEIKIAKVFDANQPAAICYGCWCRQCEY